VLGDALGFPACGVDPLRIQVVVRVKMLDNTSKEPGVRGRLRHGAAIDALGRHVVGTNLRHPLFPGLAREAEVDELHAVVLVDQDIVNLNVAMDPAAAVQVLQRVEHLVYVVHQLGNRHDPLRKLALLVHCEHVIAQRVHLLYHHAGAIGVLGVGLHHRLHPDYVLVRAL